MKLSVRQKGLVALLIVLALQLTFILSFFFGYAHADDLAVQGTQHQTTVEQCNWLGALLCGTTCSCFGYAMTGDDQCFHLYKRNKTLLIEELHALSIDMNNSAEQRQRADRSIGLVHNILSVMDGTLLEPPQHNPHLIQLIRLEIVPALTKLNSTREQLVSDEHALARHGPEQAQAVRNSFLLTLAALDILALGGLSVLFLLYFCRRLAALSENARRFTDKEPLQQSMAGTDEFAAIDNVLHQMADSTKTATQQKNQIVAIVKSEMHNSLASVQDTLEYLLEEHEDKLPEDAQKRLNAAHSGVQSVLKQIATLPR